MPSTCTLKWSVIFLSKQRNYEFSEYNIPFVFQTLKMMFSKTDYWNAVVSRQTFAIQFGGCSHRGGSIHGRSTPHVLPNVLGSGERCSR